MGRLGCESFSPWIRPTTNITTSSFHHLNLCFFDTIVSGTHVFLMLLIVLMSAVSAKNTSQGWSKVAQRVRRIANLGLPAILLILSALIGALDEVHVRTEGTDGDRMHTLGYSVGSKAGVVLGASFDSLYWILYLVAVLIASRSSSVWIVPRSARWLTVVWSVASFLRVQSSIEAIVKYRSASDWPFGEATDAEENSFSAQVIRVTRFALLILLTAMVVTQRDTPPSDFDESPTDAQIAEFERSKEEEEGVPLSSVVENRVVDLSKPLLPRRDDDRATKEEIDENASASSLCDENAPWMRNLPTEAGQMIRRGIASAFDGTGVLSTELHERVDSLRQRSNEIGASIFETLTFSWMNAQVEAGTKAPLRTHQLHLLHGDDLPDENARAILRAYVKSGGVGEGGGDDTPTYATFRQRASVVRTIFSVYRWPIIFSFALSSLKVVVTLAQPMILQEVIRAIERPNDDESSPHWIGFFWCSLYIVLVFISTLVTMQVNRTMGRVGAQIRGGFTAIIYAKGLKLTQAARQRVGEGKIVSLMEVDAAKLEWGIYTFLNCFSLVLLLIGAVALLWHLAGAAALASLCVMLVLFLPSAWAMSNAIPHWPKTMALKDRRVRLLTELLQSMRLTKALGWDGAMLDRVQATRKDEATERFMLVSWFSVLWSIGMSSPVFINLITLVWYVLATGKTLTASLGAPLFQLTGIIQGPVNGLPTSLGVLLQVKVSLDRIDSFLKQEEVCTGRLGKGADNDGDEGKSPGGVESPAVVHKHARAVRYFRCPQARGLGPYMGDKSRHVAVRMRSVRAVWGSVEDQDAGIFAAAKRDAAARRKLGSSSFCCRVIYRSIRAICCCTRRRNSADESEAKAGVATKEKEGDEAKDSKTETAELRSALRDVNLAIPSGELVCIVGKVGAGKSTLLAAMLNEVGLSDGSSVEVAGSIAYCAQQPWIQNLNVRQNILFGLPFNAKRYARAVSAAALWTDLMQLPDGDETEIGERGLTLSGGQKARVALARAVYADADVVLLDDIFSAVDAHVAVKLADDCVLGALANKTRVLVTHAVGLLPRLAEKSKGRMTLVIVEDGAIKHTGRYEDIIRLGLDVTSYASPAVAPLSPAEASSTAPSSSSSKTEGLSPKADADEEITLRRSSTGVSSVTKAKSVGQQTKKLVRDEDRAIGSVKFAVWRHFFVTFGIPYTIVFFVAAILGNGSNLVNAFWLARWMDSGRHDEQIFYISIYAALQMWTVLCIVAWIVDLAFARYHMSIVVHRKSLWGVFRSPMSYFDSTRLGRIINRFSADLNSVDTELCWNVVLLLNCILSVLFSLSYIFVTNYWILALVIPCAYFYYRTMERYRASARELKRLASITRSPVFSAFTEALNGASTVRAFRADARFNRKHLRRLELNIGANLNQQALQQWLDVRLSVISVGLLAPVIYFGLLQHLEGWRVSAVGTSFSAGVFSVAIGKCSEVSSALETLIRQFTSAETALVCMERLLALQKLPSEPPLFITGEEALKRENDKLRERASAESEEDDLIATRADGYASLPEEGDDVRLPVDAWPTRGRIVFENVSMRYREDLPTRLKHLSFTIPAGTSVGVCGRTGAGKSSILQALLRLTPIVKDGGRILIDDLNITTEVGLHKLRSRLALIPQDPTLFSGTVRSNLDPFHQYTDSDIWQALRLVQLDAFVRKQCTAGDDDSEDAATKDSSASFKSESESETTTIAKNPLDMVIAERGENLSVGQRQLLCLARALVRRSKILLLDEATASVDPTTDACIQNALRDFVAKSKSTVLTIAHRIETIVRSDLIVVMDDGHVKEIGAPSKLLADPTTEFSKLYAESRSDHKRNGDG